MQFAFIDRLTIFSTGIMLKVDSAAVGFVICTACRTILPSSTRLEKHQCNQLDKGTLPQDETYVDEYLVRRMNKVSGPANPLYIQEEVRACFEACRWADLLLVCPTDNYSVRAHSLILAAASSLLANLFSSLPVTDQEDLTLVLMDTTRDELIPFLSHLYGQTLTSPNPSNHLFQLVDCHQRPKVQEETVIEVKGNLAKTEQMVLPEPSSEELYGGGFEDSSMPAEPDHGAAQNEEACQARSING